MRYLLGAVAALLAAIAVPLAGAATSSAGKGQVGGPPTMAIGGLSAEEGKKTTPAIVIGRGHAYDGPVEIAAFGFKPPPDDPVGGKQFCVLVEYPPRDINFGSCGSALEPLEGGAIEINSQQQALGPKPVRYTEIGGVINPEVAKVRLFYHRHGDKKRAHVVIGHVTAELQNKLKQPALFGYFDAKVRGLVGFARFRARAYDAGGHLLDVANHLSRSAGRAR
jgi:hypothetical protein